MFAKKQVDFLFSSFTQSTFSEGGVSRVSRKAAEAAANRRVDCGYGRGLHLPPPRADEGPMEAQSIGAQFSAPLYDNAELRTTALVSAALCLRRSKRISYFLPLPNRLSRKGARGTRSLANKERFPPHIYLNFFSFLSPEIHEDGEHVEAFGNHAGDGIIQHVVYQP